MIIVHLINHCTRLIGWVIDVRNVVLRCGSRLVFSAVFPPSETKMKTVFFFDSEPFLFFRVAFYVIYNYRCWTSRGVLLFFCCSEVYAPVYVLLMRRAYVIFVFEKILLILSYARYRNISIIRGYIHPRGRRNVQFWRALDLFQRVG